MLSPSFRYIASKNVCTARFVLSFSLIVMGNFVWQAHAQTSVRETCRAALNSQLLRYQNKKIMAQETEVSTKQKLSRLAEMEKELEEKVRKLRTELAVSDFDREKEMRLSSLDHQLVSLENEKKVLDKNRGWADATRKMMRKKIASDSKALSEVFFIRRQKTPGSQFETSVLAYKQKCPKFEQTCPLENSYASALESLSLSFDLPLSCRRYATIGRYVD